jgi:hypothetical protein
MDFWQADGRAFTIMSKGRTGIRQIAQEIFGLLLRSRNANGSVRHLAPSHGGGVI